LTQKRLGDVLFVNIYYNKNNEEALRIYPAYSLRTTYDPKTTTWYTATKKYALDSSTDWIKIIGPYMDSDRTGNRLMAISLPLASDGVLVGAICLEYLTISFDEFVNDVTFLSTGEAVIINSEYKIISAPESWGLSSSQIYTVDSSQVKNFMNSDGTAVLEGPTETSAETLKSLQRVVSSTNSTVVDYYYTKVLFDASTNVTSNWLYGVFLYTQIEDANQVNVKLTSLMKSDLVTLAIVTTIAIILTLLIVACVSFNISTKISRPLRKLMEFSDLVNKNTANKTLANKFFHGLDTDESLTGELIQIYKKVIGISVEPKKSRYLAKSQVTKKEEVEYPLNQFHSEFISKTKGESPINWKSLIEQVRDDK